METQEEASQAIQQILANVSDIAQDIPAQLTIMSLEDDRMIDLIKWSGLATAYGVELCDLVIKVVTLAFAIGYQRKERELDKLDAFGE